MNEGGQILKATVEKRYYPMYLANGVDTLLVGWNGTPVINYKKRPTSIPASDLYWYKANRRNKDGLLLALPTSWSLLMVGELEYRIKGFIQWFEPDKAVLHTTVKTMGPEYEVTTFLTQEHVLVEHIQIKTNPTGMPLYFDIGCWEPGPDVANRVSGTAVHTNFKKDTIYVEYRDGKLKGNTAIFTGGEVPLSTATRFRIRFGPVDKSFTKYTCVIDNVDRKDYEKRTQEVAAECRREGYDGIEKKHVNFWQKYHRASSIDLPDKLLEFKFYLANYMNKGILHRETGLWTAGGLPSQWNAAGPLWDSYFAHRGFLQTNHLEEARSIVSNLATYVNSWRKEAGKLGRTGAYTWSAREYRRNVDILFINGMFAVEFWNQHVYTGERKVLEKFYFAIKELVDFLMDDAIIEKKDYAYIRKCYTVEEIKYKRWNNDAWTAATTIKALEAMVEGAKIIAKNLDGSYERKLIKLKKGFQKNFKDGVLTDGYGLNEIRYATSSFQLMPELDGKRTVAQVLKNQNKFKGLMPEIHLQEETLTYPWLDFKVASIMASYGDSRTYKRIITGLKHINSLGGLCESVNIDGVFWVEWFSSVQGALLMAICNMMVNSVGKRLLLFPGIPKKWKEASFGNFLTSSGLEVSAKIERGVIENIMIKNRNEYSGEIELWLPSHLRKQPLTDRNGKFCHHSSKIIIPPGKIWVLQSNL